MKKLLRIFKITPLFIIAVYFLMFLEDHGKFIYIPLAVIISLIIIGIISSIVSDKLLISKFKKKWFPQNKVALLVYSDSPNWKEYIDKNWIPKIGNRVTTLNWSESNQPGKEKSLESKIHLRFSPPKGYVPMIIFFNKKGPPQVISFHKAFLNFKHEKDYLLKKKEKQLFELLKT